MGDASPDVPLAGHYNFCWIYSTIDVTPAMEAAITDHVWTVEELLKAA